MTLYSKFVNTSNYGSSIQPSTSGDTHRQRFTALPRVWDRLFLVVMMHLLSLNQGWIMKLDGRISEIAVAVNFYW